MRISVEVLVKAVRSKNVSEIPLQEEKLTVVFLCSGSGTRLFLDSEPEGDAATPKGLAIEKRGKWCYNVNSDGQETKLSLSSSPSVKNLQHHFAWLSMVAEIASEWKGGKAGMPT